MIKDRIEYYKEIASSRNSSVLVYVTGDRQGMETQMHPEVIDIMTEHLDAMKNTNKISLILHSRGGDTSAGWSICNLLRSFCTELEVIIPARAHSAATLLSLGADNIIMTKQATLGPIDPNVNSPLNPLIPGGGSNARVGVSVESIEGFVQLAKEKFNITDSVGNAQILSVLAEKVHPLVLGNAFRARSHIRMLATKLLEFHFSNKRDEEQINAIVDFLSSDSGSHDYTINRKEAKDQLGLSIEKPSLELYSLINNVYKDIVEELELKNRFDPALLVANTPKKDYICKRALIESVDFGSHSFKTQGTVIKTQQQTPNGIITQIQDNRAVEGWSKDD